MKLAESIVILRRILGQGEKTEAQERVYRIELAALTDLYEGHPYNDQRWNITEAYTYRQAYERGRMQRDIEGKGVIADYTNGGRHE